MKLWKDCAASEARIKLIAELKNKNIGFNEIEQFGLGLKYSLKSKQLVDKNEKQIEKVIEAAMRLKLKDEIQHNKELKKEKNIERNRMTRKYHQQTETYKKTMKYLRQEAEKTRRLSMAKYKRKMGHLETRYRERRGETEEGDTVLPPGMENLAELRVFSAEKYEKIEIEEISVHRIGNIEITREEEELLKRNPKFSIPTRLEEDTLSKEMEKAYSLIRMELREEEEEKKVEETEKMDENLEQRQKEDEAKTRQVYDPIEKRYDEGKRRVTDLEECSRVTLPKPLSVRRETEIELRRESHNRVYQRYRQEFCNMDGEQKSNLTENEKMGLKRLKKRIKDGELVVMKTDKSGKMSVTDRENYIQMGQEHVKNDKKIGNEEVRKIDKIMNEHSTAWCNMWGTGRHHGQEDRIINSKTSKSENRAKLYLTHKDHKKDPGKTRPIGTANCSNTRGFANCVSDLLEALANSEEESYEVISSEDLISSTKEHNVKVEGMKTEVMTSRKRKLECTYCKTWRIRCRNCVEETVVDCVEEHDTDKEKTLTEMTLEIVEEVIEMIEETRNDHKRQKVEGCEECKEEIKKAMKENCKFCGDGIDYEIPRMALVGMDAVALFPSLTGKKTAKLVRETAEKTTMLIDGFDWRRGMIYVRMNKQLTTIRKEMRRFLPIRKSLKGTEPGMGAESVKKRKYKLENQWIFPRKNPTEKEIKEIMGMVLEIAIRVLWENYCYSFGGETFLQQEGGPIGQRPTMAASRIVMNCFFRRYNEILKNAGLVVTLLKVYVDDGRQATTLLKRGMRYEEERGEFVWNEAAEREDMERMKDGEEDDEFMARLCLKAMNHINEDITFTTEVASEFSNKKLPTLDLNLRMRENFTITHTYFEKSMKSQKLIEKDSAMTQRQKYSILSNELTRRLYNIDEEDDESRREVAETIENFTKQLKTSGWERKEAEEMVKSGFIGWRRRIDRRLEQGGVVYRDGRSSLKTRTTRKLLGKETWYKEETKRNRDEYDDWEDEQRWSKRIRRLGPKREEEERNRVIAVMFVPYTPRGELARRLREVESDIEKQTGNKLKIVERSGMKIVDLLHKSDPWEGVDCERRGCILCKTKQKTGKNMGQDCHRRNIVYETWCMTCENRDKREIEENEDYDEETRKRKIREVKIYKYVGESSRSLYERGLEHLRDLEELKADSHMLKHYFEKHIEEKLEEMEFGARIVDKPRSAFNRQISESVTIQNQNMKNNILNSKSEYNRCALPRLTANLGEIPVGRMEKELNEKKRKEKEEEKDLQIKIRDLRVRRSMDRRETSRENEQPAKKRRKLGNMTHKRVMNWTEQREKRKIEEENQGKEQKTVEVTKMRKTEDLKELEEKLPEGLEYEGGRKKTEEELLEEWNKRLKEREEQITKEETERKERLEKAKRLQKGWELMRICKEIIEENGEKWKKSKERREYEKAENEEREERRERAENQKMKTLEKLETNRIQRRITDCLKSLPQNRRRILELEEDKKRRLLLEEAETELWRKWRQKKGRGMKSWAKVGEKETLDEKLRIVEEQTERYKLEVERIEKRRKNREEEDKRTQSERVKRLEEKTRNERHWEMMRWLTKFMMENKEIWSMRRETEIEERRKREEVLEWRQKSEQEKINILKGEEKRPESREEKIAKARECSRRWRMWREKEEENDETTTGENDESEGGVPQGPFISIYKTLLQY